MTITIRPTTVAMATPIMAQLAGRETPLRYNPVSRKVSKEASCMLTIKPNISKWLIIGVDTTPHHELIGVVRGPGVVSHVGTGRNFNVLLNLSPSTGT